MSNNYYATMTDKILRGKREDYGRMTSRFKVLFLFTMDNFVATPHMAAHTNEGMARMSLVAKDVLAVLEGRSPEFPVPGN